MGSGAASPQGVEVSFPLQDRSPSIKKQGPDVSGLDLCRSLRNRSCIPIILLTALKEDVDRIIGLELGAGATVSIRRKSNSVFIDIVDKGPGIPEELLARAFEPFFRVDPARSSTAGAGLGLAIAKEIIHRNRGTLILANGASGGLIQTIEVPAAPN